MRVAALYDIHGNLPALEAVLDEVRAAGVDRIVVGGDVVPGPMARASLERLLDRDLPIDFIRGNCEVAMLAERRGGPPAYPLPPQVLATVRWAAADVGELCERVVAAWPMTLTLAVDGLGDVLFCHGTPRDENEIFTDRTSDDRVRAMFDGVTAPVVVCGHTHIQSDRRVGSTRIVNAGSVGMPFQEAGAYWLLLGPDVALRRTDYDRDAAAARIRATAYPDADAFAARWVLDPPSKEQMLDMYAPAAQPPRT